MHEMRVAYEIAWHYWWCFFFYYLEQAIQINSKKKTSSYSLIWHEIKLRIVQIHVLISIVVFMRNRLCILSPVTSILPISLSASSLIKLYAHRRKLQNTEQSKSTNKNRGNILYSNDISRHLLLSVSSLFCTASNAPFHRRYFLSLLKYVCACCWSQCTLLLFISLLDEWRRRSWNRHRSIHLSFRFLPAPECVSK